MVARIEPPFASAEVEACFASFPEPTRARLLTLRALIFKTAAATPGVAAVEETLKWGQPSYRADKGMSSPIRLGVPKEGGYAIYAHCQTSIVPDFRTRFPEDFTYEGTRAVHFGADDLPDAGKLSTLIRHALTYHRKTRA